MNDRWLAWVRIGFALLVIAAIIFQAGNLIGTGIYAVGILVLLVGVVWPAATIGPALRARRRD